MTPRRRTAMLLAALVLLGFGWALAPRSAPPLYDGVGFPDEPYRFVVKPAGAQDTKPPTAATGRTQVLHGQAGAISASSAEQAPQVSVLIPVGRLHAPAGTSQIVVTASPQRPIAAPSGGHLWSNVYDVHATEPGVTMSDGSPPATITLRAATAQRPIPRIERYTGTRWVTLPTIPAGRDIYQASLPTLGKYAVIGSKPLDVSLLKTDSSATTPTGIFIAIGVGVAVIALAAVAIWRRRRARRT